ncbi:hypothetical protein DOTSEDRAFT_24352 [Dothistroma septosporum NZE10]|uniref:Uncharacterized protein n=1 Tax=Dothistroma septosporum (strain NZE10 / CBS 128990) TaxID=675120 RepID=N1PMZ0_DOTSN|nr:hypothetical protein DOTSEDRAFT_24352 [Dothistroma septosporum NZE10]
MTLLLWTTNGYGYRIACGAALLRNDIGSPTFAAGISECLPLFDQIVRYLGVQHSAAPRQCIFESSEDAVTTYGNLITFAGRIILEETTTTSSSVSATSTSSVISIDDPYPPIPLAYTKTATTNSTPASVSITSSTGNLYISVSP